MQQIIIDRQSSKVVAAPIKEENAESTIFLERLSEDIADLIPDTNEQHLPYFRKA